MAWTILVRGSPKEHFCKIVLKLVQWFLTKRLFKCDLDMQWTGTIWTTLKVGQPRIIPVKFGQNPISGLGGDVIWRNLFTGACTDAHTDGWPHYGRQTKWDHKSSPYHYMTGELKFVTLGRNGEKSPCVSSSLKDSLHTHTHTNHSWPTVFECRKESIRKKSIRKKSIGKKESGKKVSGKKISLSFMYKG